MVRLLLSAHGRIIDHEEKLMFCKVGTLAKKALRKKRVLKLLCFGVAIRLGLVNNSFKLMVKMGIEKPLVLRTTFKITMRHAALQSSEIILT